MVLVKENHIEQLNVWRKELLEEIETLENDLEQRILEDETLELKINIINQATEKYSLGKNEREAFWDKYCEKFDQEFAKRLAEETEFKNENRKKQRELKLIVSTIEDLFKRNNFEF